MHGIYYRTGRVYPIYRRDDFSSRRRGKRSQLFQIDRNECSQLRSDQNMRFFYRTIKFGLKNKRR